MGGIYHSATHGPTDVSTMNTRHIVNAIDKLHAAGYVSQKLHRLACTTEKNNTSPKFVAIRKKLPSKQIDILQEELDLRGPDFVEGTARVVAPQIDPGDTYEEDNDEIIDTPPPRRLRTRIPGSVT